MKVLTLQKRLRIMILVLALVVLSIVGGVIYPSVRAIITLQHEVDQTELFLETQYQKTRRMERTIADLDAVVSSTAAFTKLTAQQGQELALIETLETLAETHNIEQTLSVSFSEKPDERVRLAYYTFTFLNHGYFSDQVAYLDALSALPYVVHIDSIDIQRRNNARTTEDNPLSETTFKYTARIYAK